MLQTYLYMDRKAMGFEWGVGDGFLVGSRGWNLGGGEDNLSSNVV